MDTHPLVRLYKKLEHGYPAEGASDIIRLNIGRKGLNLRKEEYKHEIFSFHISTSVCGAGLR